MLYVRHRALFVIRSGKRTLLLKILLTICFVQRITKSPLRKMYHV
jgi:hypothetical protein